MTRYFVIFNLIKKPAHAYSRENDVQLIVASLGEHVYDLVLDVQNPGVIIITIQAASIISWSFKCGKYTGQEERPSPRQQKQVLYGGRHPPLVDATNQFL